MDLNQIFGWLASIGSIIYLSLGIPFQIWKNYKNKSTKGVSLWFIIFMVISISLWLAYAWTKQPKDWFIFASNFPGLIFAIILLSQFAIYKDR